MLKLQLEVQKISALSSKKKTRCRIKNSREIPPVKCLKRKSAKTKVKRSIKFAELIKPIGKSATAQRSWPTRNAAMPAASSSRLGKLNAEIILSHSRKSKKAAKITAPYFKRKNSDLSAQKNSIKIELKNQHRRQVIKPAPFHKKIVFNADQQIKD